MKPKAITPTTNKSQNGQQKTINKLTTYTILTLITLTLALWTADHIYPLPDLHNRDDYARLITAKDGTPLRAFAGKGGVWRYPLHLSQVSPLYLEALLGYEDKYFYHHFGVNPVAILRGCIQNIKAGRIISGGSTLTMQVARLINPHRRGYKGKILQILRALQLEYHFTKDEILTLYLNYAPFGGTVEGVGAASLTYLGKPPLELSHAEAALLAVLPQRPSGWRPDRYPALAERARNKVLNRLVTNKVWEPSIVEAAKQEKVAAVHYEHPMTAPLLANRLRSKALPDQPLVTTIDGQLQANIADCVSGYVENMDSGVSAAVMVVENDTLAVRAYVGSADFFSITRQGQVDMIRAVRSPGSTLKPFLYGMALDRGLIHSASLLSDAPQYYSDYRPGNFSAGFSGPVTMSAALQRSLNLPAIQVIEHLGPGVFAAALTGGGLKLKIPKGGAPNPAIVLGGLGVRLEELTGAYTALARNGRSGKLRYLAAELTDPIREKYMLSEGAAWIIRSILADTPRPNRYRTAAVASHNLAWKTGTSYGFRDAWAMGVTPKYTIGVWVGRPDGTPSPGASGAQTAAPLLFTISDYLAKPGEFFTHAPPSVSSRIICWPLGTTKSELPNSGLCHEEYLAHILDNNSLSTLPS
ncbi:MAG: penicillin-binding protein 1C, partial [Desulfobulbaceae bacterium]|nr:penicillin-binding protein 1C [Desulfobulbaceae bacterium]